MLRILVIIAAAIMMVSCRSSRRVVSETDQTIQKDSVTYTFTADDYYNEELEEMMKVSFRTIKNLKDSTIIVEGRIETDTKRKECKAQGAKIQQTEMHEAEHKTEKKDSVVKETPATIAAENMTKGVTGVYYYIATIVAILILIVYLISRNHE